MRLESLRHRLATADAVPHLAILGALAGLSTGIVMLIFRAVVELPLMAFLPGHNSEMFEGLSPAVRACLVVGGAVVLGFWLDRVERQHQSVGVVHVMERLHDNHGRLPLPNAIVQFIGGALALVTGQSGGREGPAIHLGSSASSLLGQYLDLPNNSIRTLVACGTAAAIAGSFNTPLAGVIFAMEVVMMEYSIASFTPVILAAVTSTLVSQAVFGNHTAFEVPTGIEIHSLAEYPILLVEGILVGCIAGAFLAAMRSLGRLQIDSALARFAIAGGVTAIVSIGVPQVMGIGYDTVELALQGQIALQVAVYVVAAKVVVSAITYALRMPVGIIGPTLVVGACTGAALGAVAHSFVSYLASDTPIYVMLRMGAMMGAVLQAPLSALIAIVELTGTPNITLPAMLAIVVATITTNSLFKQRSVFLTALEARGFNYPADPITQHMRRTGVSGVMQRNFVVLQQRVSRDDVIGAVRSHASWIVVDGHNGPVQVLTPEQLGYHVRDVVADQRHGEGEALIDLGERLRVHAVASIDIRATLYEAWKILEDPKIAIICVLRMTGTVATQGVLTREDVLRSARFDV